MNLFALTLCCFSFYSPWPWKYVKIRAIQWSLITAEIYFDSIENHFAERNYYLYHHARYDDDDDDVRKEKNVNAPKKNDILILLVNN